MIGGHGSWTSFGKWVNENHKSLRLAYDLDANYSDIFVVYDKTEKGD